MNLLKELYEILRLITDGQDNALIEEAKDRLSKLIEKVKDGIEL
jgi:hypothetical protein